MASLGQPGGAVGTASQGEGREVRIGDQGRWGGDGPMVEGGYCRLQVPLRLAVAGHRLGALSPTSNAPPPPHTVQFLLLSQVNLDRPLTPPETSPHKSPHRLTAGVDLSLSSSAPSLGPSPNSTLSTSLGLEHSYILPSSAKRRLDSNFIPRSPPRFDPREFRALQH